MKKKKSLQNLFGWLLLAISEVFASSYDEMTNAAKVGALFVLPVLPEGGEDRYQECLQILNDYHVRFVLLKQGTIKQAKEMVQRLRKDCSRDITVLVDAEWGLGMRLWGGDIYLKNLALGAIKDDIHLYEIGVGIGRQMKEIGANINLAPVVDVNSNYKNPIIHMRSFGSDPKRVTEKSALYMQGLLDAGCGACIKHFPGHGDVEIDSHIALPSIYKDLRVLKEIDLYPFQELIGLEVPMVMTAHIAADELTGEKDLPIGMSKKVVTDLLKEDMGFKGVVISDALNMAGIKDQYTPEEIAYRYLVAGHDLLLYGDHISKGIQDIFSLQFPRAYEKILREVEENSLDLRDKVEKILHLQKRFEAEAKVYEDFNRDNLKLEIARLSLVLWKDLPETSVYSYIAVGDDQGFQETLEKNIHPTEDAKTIIVAGFPKTYAPNEKFGVIPVLEELAKIPSEKQIVLIWFGSPYAAKYFPKDLPILFCHEACEETKQAATEVLLKKLIPTGTLSVEWLLKGISDW